MTSKAKIFYPSRLTLALTLGLCTLPIMAQAQQMPDAGQLLQQNRPVPVLPKVGSTLQITPPTSAATLPGGTMAALSGVTFSGHTLFSSEQLGAILQDAVGQSFDLAGLQGLAQKISEHYRAAGYPFARAFVPEQPFANGVLQIAVIEGRYGQVSTTGDKRLAPLAQYFLNDLMLGSVIESTQLERVTLILDDQPGIRTMPLIRPGQEFGTGDLVIDVASTPALKGEWGLDNHGNRYTGAYRARANLQWDSPFLLGDQMVVRGNVSDESQWLGNIGYNLPLGVSGLRGNINYSHTSYELAKQFAHLNATGTANIFSAGLSYPLLRSSKSNLSLIGNYQHKKLDDQQGAAGTRSDKKAHVLPLTVQFDHRDAIGGGGVTYGNLSYTLGRVNLDHSLRAADAVSAKTQGSFNKWNLDIARLQATSVKPLTLFGRLSTQSASKNLDSSEDFGLGGANGVRAYPAGEGFGDAGWLVQLEARYQIDSIAPYAFYDAGHTKINKTTWADGNNERDLAGYGVGVRYNQPAWNVDAALAWRSRGGQPTSDTADHNPRLWVTVGWRF